MGLARIPDMVWKGAEMFELTQKGDNFLLAGSSCPWKYNKQISSAISQQSWQAQIFLKLQHSCLDNLAAENCIYCLDVDFIFVLV